MQTYTKQDYVLSQKVSGVSGLFGALGLWSGLDVSAHTMALKWKANEPKEICVCVCA